MRPIVWMVLLLLTLPANAQQVYKWKDDKGRWQFTDTPPPTSGAEKTNIQNRPNRAQEAAAAEAAAAPPGAPPAAPAVAAKAPAQPAFQDEGTRLKFEGAAREGKVMIGMNRDQAKRGAGAPSGTDVMAAPGGEREVWIYRDAPAGAISRIHFENGRVVRTVTSEGPAMAGRAGSPLSPAPSVPSRDERALEKDDRQKVAREEKCRQYKAELASIRASGAAGYSDVRAGDQQRDRQRQISNAMRDANCSNW